jgi:hypothetical protein
MKCSEIKKTLESLKFSHSGKIKSYGSKLLYESNDDVIDKGPHVYCWVLNSGNQSEILYVGKAGKGIFQRMKQHERGFLGPSKSGSKSGLEKAKQLKDYLEKCNDINVYIRTPNQYHVPGLKEKVFASGLSFEEDAFIKYFREKNFSLKMNKSTKE